MDVALLAEWFLNVPLICGHSGGDWEPGVRAGRTRPNVFIEFSGSLKAVAKWVVARSQRSVFSRPPAPAEPPFRNRGPGPVPGRAQASAASASRGKASSAGSPSLTTGLLADTLLQSAPFGPAIADLVATESASPLELAALAAEKSTVPTTVTLVISPWPLTAALNVGFGVVIHRGVEEQPAEHGIGSG